MAEQDRISDQGIYAVVDKVIQDLLPFDPNSRLRVYRTVGTFFGFEDSYLKVAENMDGRVPASLSREPKFTSSEELTPKEFMLQKRPNTDVERVACLAYYLAHYRDTRHFKTTDISKLNTEAAQIKLSTASNTISNGVKTGYFTAAGKGMKQLSAQGEKYVEALPDLGAAKEVGPQKKPRRSRKKIGVSRAENGRGQEQVDPSE